MLQIITNEAEIKSIFFEAMQWAVENLPEKSATPKEEIIDSKALMKRLDISEPTLQRSRDKGRIPYIQQDNVVRYNWPKVLEALEKRRGGKK